MFPARFKNIHESKNMDVQKIHSSCHLLFEPKNLDIHRTQLCQFKLQSNVAASRFLFRSGKLSVIEILVSHMASVQLLIQPAAGVHRFGCIVGMDRFPFSPFHLTELITGLSLVCWRLSLTSLPLIAGTGSLG